MRVEDSQRYIGVPNGVVFCVDHVIDRQPTGRFYQAYSRMATEIAGMDELIFKMEQFLDSIQFPYPSTETRTFVGSRREALTNQERTKMMSDEELLSKHGDLGTFIIRVQHRQNSSWQGRITWSERNKTVYFRSIWEMIRLIADALDRVGGKEGEITVPNWPEEDDDIR